jgi:hypothetical protein
MARPRVGDFLGGRISFYAASMAKLSAQCSHLGRGFAAIAAACLFLIQLLALTPSGLGAGHLGLSAAPLCAADRDDGGLPATPAAHRLCTICAAAATPDTPPDPIGASAPVRPAQKIVPPAPPRDLRALSPPGWTSSWSSQAPPRSV